MAKKIKRPTIEELRQKVEVISKQQPKDSFSEKYPCPQCDSLHDYRSDAADCCEWQIDMVYVCNLCDEDEGETFDSEGAVKTHITADHGNNTIGDPEEIYLEKLREGKPMLGQWQIEMEATTEFLIPNA